MNMLLPEEAAIYLLGKGAKRNTLDQWRYRGEGPNYCEVGNLVYYPQADLDDFLSRSKHKRTVLEGPTVYRT